MTDYTELVKALRICCKGSCVDCDRQRQDKCLKRHWNNENLIDGMLCEAAAAIEALNRLVDLNTERCEALRKQLREAHENYERHLNELEAQLPKQGEWIKHPEVKNIYGGEYIECPFCGEKYVVQNVSDEKFCRNCGADLRAKMEVQE